MIRIGVKYKDRLFVQVHSPSGERCSGCALKYEYGAQLESDWRYNMCNVEVVKAQGNNPCGGDKVYTEAGPNDHKFRAEYIAWRLSQ